MGQKGTGELPAVWAELLITPCYGFMHPPARLEPWEIILEHLSLASSIQSCGTSDRLYLELRLLHNKARTWLCQYYVVYIV